MEGGELVKDGWQAQQSRGKENKYSISGAVRKAVDLVHPVDRSRALDTAIYALTGSINIDEKRDLGLAHTSYPFLGRFESHPDTTFEDALRVVERAIKSQGLVNDAVRKFKGRK